MSEVRTSETNSGSKTGKDDENTEESRLHMHPHDDPALLVNYDGLKRDMRHVDDANNDSAKTGSASPATCSSASKAQSNFSRCS
ncbi:hypothetical protein D9619_003851 [Psilocybe cf. subviscida]|uniref:Uncharacterized protein n=1 Tax=Psilocybe cf. subviscida TaxID=2480587 RepID=A0A8H5AXA5_9AGAR|nr:hypothetical protein D9619_003851 [Psilocybe cf. subviscida]